MSEAILPVLLAGGSGTRLWPASRRDRPKQFVTLIGEQSLFQLACRRFAGDGFSAPAVLGNADHRFLMAEQAIEAGLERTSIVLEPVGRDTAAAACVAALVAGRENPARLVVLAPCDHIVGDDAAFRAAVLRGAGAARAGRIVVFGVPPTSPHTGYGYLELGDATAATGDARPVARFVEKPDRQTAERYLADGRHLWNSGIFLFSAGTMLAAFEALQPAILNACRAALAGATVDLDFVRLDAAAYKSAPAISLDYGIMEKFAAISCVALDTAWSDCGSWAAVREVSAQDPNGNALSGDVHVVDTVNSVVRSEGPLVTVTGLSDIVVVATGDAVLVAPTGRSEEVKGVVGMLERAGREEIVAHPRTYRPWGWYERLRIDDRYQVKRLMVKPGARLSLQSHVHRAEHWVVVSGSIEVTRGRDVFLLSENASTFIPVGERHRIANPGKIAAILIEVQSGGYIGEDDIVRYDDVYGRAAPSSESA
ncbi:MAG: mannose-1-phosphate guanylyltransferase/mannose-6-phosphate isomerase [Bauldia sp.]